MLHFIVRNIQSFNLQLFENIFIQVLWTLVNFYVKALFKVTSCHWNLSFNCPLDSEAPLALIEMHLMKLWQQQQQLL